MISNLRKSFIRLKFIFEAKLFDKEIYLKKKSYVNSYYEIVYHI
jgi:hypothetical protein